MTVVTPRTTVDVTRYVMYRADTNADGKVNRTDVVNNGKLAAGLLAIRGAQQLTASSVRSIVARHAGADGVVSDREYARLSASIRRTTGRMADRFSNVPPPAPSTLQVIGGFIAAADATYDGKIDAKDLAAGSDMARAVLEIAQRDSLDPLSMLEAIDAMPLPTRPERVGQFLTSASWMHEQYISQSSTLGDTGRGGMRALDRNQDLLLTAADGVGAQRVLRAAKKTTMRERDLETLYRRYDVRGVNGSTTPDGRLDWEEIVSLP
jgi:hypothetical protein